MYEICSREIPYKNINNPVSVIKMVTLDKMRPDLRLLPYDCPIQV